MRLVGRHEHDAGYIDNKVGTRTYPASGITVSNAKDCPATPGLECTGRAKKAYNDVDTNGTARRSRSTSMATGRSARG